MSLIPFITSQNECGIDEAGRGSLCGRVYVAAVVLPPIDLFPDATYLKICDSKKVGEKKRFMLRNYIETNAVAFSVTFAEVEEIDSVNILQATMNAMHRAIENLLLQVDIESIAVDGNYWRPFRRQDASKGNTETETDILHGGVIIPATKIVHGDSKYLHIAAASILAKTYRDEYMCTLPTLWTERYFWKKNKGYGTQDHMKALQIHGPSPLHRKSFKIPEKIQNS